MYFLGFLFFLKLQSNSKLVYWKINSARLGIPFSKLSKVLRTDNLDKVMKKEALNEQEYAPVSGRA